MIKTKIALMFFYHTGKRNIIYVFKKNKHLINKYLK